MAPPLFLLLLIVLSAAAVLWSAMDRSRRRRAVRAVAQQWNMRYAARDPFNLAGRAARAFPIPGVAIFSVSDVIYSQQKDTFRYVFTAEFTQGVLHHQHRVRCAATFTESRIGEINRCSQVKLAQTTLPLASQYQALLEGEGFVVGANSVEGPAADSTSD